MKLRNLLSIVLLFICSVSFAHIGAQTAKFEDISKAVKDSFSVRDLNCKKDGVNYMASKIDWNGLDSSNTKVEIKEGRQPVVVFYHTNKDQSILHIEITTNSDYTLVERLQSFTITQQKIKKNVGTIINPRYEEVVTETRKEQFLCE